MLTSQEANKTELKYVICLYISRVQNSFFIWHIYQFFLPLYWNQGGVLHMRKLKQSFPLKFFTENVSDFILQCLCPRYSDRVNTQWSVFPIKMMTDLQAFLLTLILAHWSIFFYCLDPYFWSFLLVIGKVLWKITENLCWDISAKIFFLICLPMKTSSFSPDQLRCPDFVLAASFQCVILSPDADMTFKFSFPHSSPSLQFILDSLLPVPPMSKHRPRLFLESCIHPATCLEWYPQGMLCKEGIKRYYKTSGWDTLPDSCNKGLVAFWADNSLQFNMFQISRWIYPPSAFLIASILVF